jgi:acyl-CoA thioester hydrolase
MTKELKLADFPHRTSDKLRYADTDRQGHVNGAVFATFLESGRVEILYDPAAPLCGTGTAFVIARLVLDLHAEINWPGVVWIGTRVASVGRSSVRLAQAIFQDDRCVATAETVIVLMDESSRRSASLAETAKKTLQRFCA